MKTLMRLYGIGLVVSVLMTTFLTWPIPAQVQPEDEDKPGPMLRIAVRELTVQGEQTPEAVRQAFSAILPQLVDCIQAEIERAGKAPNRIMLRFNLSSSGKVVWSKVIDPPLKSLDACITKVLPQVQLPPAGRSISKVTLWLETKMDHLLTP
jgi:hypothetical protein